MTRSFFKLIFATALLAASAGLAHAQPTPPPVATAAPSAQEPAKENIGRINVVQVTGEVYIFTSGETYRIALRTGSLVTPGQMIATGPKASVMLAFSNGATVTIGEKSLVSLDEFTQQPFSAMFKMSDAAKEPSTSKTRLDMVRGELIANVKKLNKNEGSNFEIKTPLGVAGIRGTTFQLSYIPEAQKENDKPKNSTGRADFALVMLEGVIEMSVPNRPHPISVTQGKQLVLENVDMLAADSATLTLDEKSVAVADVPATRQALLLQRTQSMLAAVADISIPASHAPGPGVVANTPESMGGQIEQKTEQKNNDTTTTPQTDAPPPPPANDDAISPSPTPQIPAPRLSPTDGAGKQ